MAYDEGTDSVSVARAFVAAADLGFKLFFSFDYAGRGPWPAWSVKSYLTLYMNNPAHFRHNDRPLVSTFEGPEQAEDWHNIKDLTNCFFVPDWSSLGAKAAMEAGGGVADGLFSWAAWPWGPQNMDTYVDASYLQYLAGKPYMMPVSPWFYTNLPQWKKNWLWRGDNLWFDRWQEVQTVDPEWVQIISWNDYAFSLSLGESHYIGPIRNNALAAMRSAPFNFVNNMPHDAWRTFLPTAIDLYTKKTATVTKEGVVYWYRPNPRSACSDGLTTGNTASQLQIEFPPAEVMGDSVFYTAQLSSSATITVSIGGVSVAGTWSDVPAGGAGLYHGNVTFNGRTGSVKVTLSRSGSEIASSTGTSITSSCSSVNWNAWVGQALASGSVSKSLSLKNSVCVRGTGANDFAPLCTFACEYGYCPIGACTCLARGPQKKLPPYTGVTAFPIAGRSADYSGLCSHNCNLGKIGDPGCPSSVCGTAEVPLVVPTVSPFLPPACTRGVGSPGWEGLCSYACNFGFCPSRICTCTQRGGLNQPPPVIRDTEGYALQPGVNDYGICDFACKRGYCPAGSCNQKPKSGSGEDAAISGEIWKNSDLIPVVGCSPPCVVILPPYELPTTTTISCAPTTMTMMESWIHGSPAVTTVRTISFPPIVTNQIPVFNINITQAAVDSATYRVTPSLFCVAPLTIKPPASVTSTEFSSSELTYYLTSTPPATETFPPSLTDKKTKVSFTSTDKVMPTCTSNCGKKCTGENCSDCRRKCSCISCCKGCKNDKKNGNDDDSGDDDDESPVWIWPEIPEIPIPCVGYTCPPGSSPAKAGGGGSGNPDDDDPSCSTKSETTHRTVFCKFTSSEPLWTVTTTCTSTRTPTITGCNLQPTTTTKYTSSNCETGAAYTPVWKYGAPVPGPGDKAWGGFIYTWGTYTTDDGWADSDTTTTTTPTTASSTPKPTPDGPIPTGASGMAASFAIWYWKQDSKQYYYGYDSSPPNRPSNCAAGSYQWRVDATNFEAPTSLSGVKVYGDSSCRFTKSDMKLRCNNWATATCKDWTNGSGPAGENCGYSPEKGLYNHYAAVLGCTWDY
ncbi:family 71 putative glycoside hydrolase [Triangularia setosa]|uniref:Family 71 putative glycoside hydrolase n=1 Tax=Triangularia setosa TaxID=2587417 RepID=A0AAN7A2D5_9PEZI|nr:family 71 putative glycoside hydrolase [Podospora setosa]